MAEPPHLLLVGLPGAGKSTVGRALAERLGRRFVDSDAALEAREGRSVAAVFAESGEEGFRRAEADVSQELARHPAGLVVATGGGWVTNAAAVATLRPAGRIIYLRVSAEVAVGRMGGSVLDRPLLAGGDPLAAVRRLLERREALYMQADLVLDTEALTPEETVDTVQALVEELDRP